MKSRIARLERLAAAQAAEADDGGRGWYRRWFQAEPAAEAEIAALAGPREWQYWLRGIRDMVDIRVGIAAFGGSPEARQRLVAWVRRAVARAETVDLMAMPPELPVNDAERLDALVTMLGQWTVDQWMAFAERPEIMEACWRQSQQRRR